MLLTYNLGKLLRAYSVCKGVVIHLSFLLYSLGIYAAAEILAV